MKGHNVSQRWNKRDRKFYIKFYF